MGCIEKEPIYGMYCFGRRQYQRYLNILLWGCLSCSIGCVDLVASMSGVVHLVGKIFTVSIGSVDLQNPSVFIHCVHLHQFLILCSSKAMMFVKLFFLTSDTKCIYQISLVSLDPSGLVS